MSSVIIPPVVKGELVDPLHLLPFHHGRELEHRDAIIRILKLVHVAELPAEAEHPFGRSEDLHDLIAALIRPEQNRASEHRVLAKQVARLGPRSRVRRRRENGPKASAPEAYRAAKRATRRAPHNTIAEPIAAVRRWPSRAQPGPAVVLARTFPRYVQAHPLRADSAMSAEGPLRAS